MVTWNPRYSVGHPLLDEQHRELLGLCRHAADCLHIDGDEARERFHLILNQLSDYVKKHFRTEEALLREWNYPHLAEHMAEHDAYEGRLTDFMLDASSGNIDKVGLSVYLSDWWVNHILESDRRYSEILESVSQ